MSASTRSRFRAALAAVSLFVAGCAGRFIAVEEGDGAGFRHRELGYQIAAPLDPSGAAWERFEVDGTDLAFRSPGSPPSDASTISLQSDCRRTAASPAVLARQLRIGLPTSVLLESGPVEVDGAPGWLQIFDTRAGDAGVRVKTITAAFGGCTFDWILVARDVFEPLEQSFDRWWVSFRGPTMASEPSASGGGT